MALFTVMVRYFNLQSSVVFQAHLALYCFANNQVPNALRLMYRARYLLLLCHGEYHPDIALYDVSTVYLCVRVQIFEVRRHSVLYAEVVKTSPNI